VTRVEARLGVDDHLPTRSVGAGAG
jgi:hypothetical protein